MTTIPLLGQRLAIRDRAEGSRQFIDRVGLVKQVEAVRTAFEQHAAVPTRQNNWQIGVKRLIS